MLGNKFNQIDNIHTVISDLEEHVDLCAVYIKDSFIATDSKFTVEDIKKEVNYGTVKLILAYKDEDLIGCVVVRYIDKYTASIAAMGGELGFMASYMKRMSDKVEEMVKADGVKAMVVQGRKAWLKFEKELGYRHLTSIFIKEL